MLKLPTDEIVQKYEAGASIRGLAKEYNCSITAIRDRLISNTKIRSLGCWIGYKRGASKFAMRDRNNKLAQLYEEGATLRQLAIIFDISYQRVHQILKNAN